MAVKPPAEHDEPIEDHTEDALDAALEDSAGQEVSSDKSVDESSQIAYERDRSLRLQAEMENLRTRTAREISEQARYAALPLMRDLLPVVDNIERAIDAASQSPETAALLEGFRLVHQQLLSVLEQHHCTRMNPQGEPFDPQFHAAVLQQPSGDIPANHIAMVTQAGYLLHDRVVRPAQVIISTGPASSEQ